jgi:hypothetical protein
MAVNERERVDALRRFVGGVETDIALWIERCIVFHFIDDAYAIST